MINRDAIIVAMARQIYYSELGTSESHRSYDGLNNESRSYYLRHAIAALSAIEALHPGFADYLDGKAVLIPEVVTVEMIEAWYFSPKREAYKNFIAASPYARKET